MIRVLFKEKKGKKNLFVERVDYRTLKPQNLSTKVSQCIVPMSKTYGANIYLLFFGKHEPRLSLAQKNQQKNIDALVTHVAKISSLNLIYL